MWGDAGAGLEDVGNVWFTILVERRRHADDYGLDFLDLAEIARSVEAARFDLLYDGATLNMLDVALAGVAGLDLGRIDIQAKHPRAASGELQRQRQTDISQSNNGDFHAKMFSA